MNFLVIITIAPRFPIEKHLRSFTPLHEGHLHQNTRLLSLKPADLYSQKGKHRVQERYVGQIQEIPAC